MPYSRHIIEYHAMPVSQVYKSPTSACYIVRYPVLLPQSRQYAKSCYDLASPDARHYPTIGGILLTKALFELRHLAGGSNESELAAGCHPAQSKIAV